MIGPSGGSELRYGAGASKLPVPLKSSFTLERHIAPNESCGQRRDAIHRADAPADAERGRAEVGRAAIGSEVDVLRDLERRGHEVDAGADGQARNHTGRG